MLLRLIVWKYWQGVAQYNMAQTGGAIQVLTIDLNWKVAFQVQARSDA
ncbi:MAG: hypothetical protein R2822_19785 [Spirosomataceae bacterium]